ncbi:hypothetical protein F4561_001587 [Lipingzhangella halophila]|uniref:Peptidoglycan binding protein n=1 Tax=Lipingzhangella halophila TaxID=1783352 RepID=A0A7W7REY7_9ACTN|nr:hypothetical protein [Lipingzhangella halophila]MBB4930767.1 hypothetical protein [Lipingzhangella halophila]
MVTISAPHRGTWGARPAGNQTTLDHHSWSGLRRAMYVARGVLGALFAAELVLPEAEPDQVHLLLTEVGHLDPAASAADRRAALVAFQQAAGIPAHGVADGRTVSALVKAARELWELRDLGLAPMP